MGSKRKGISKLAGLDSLPDTFTVGDCSCLLGDTRARLRDLPSASVQTCVTSPPYWGLRDYGVAQQIGAENNLNDRVGRELAGGATSRRAPGRHGSPEPAKRVQDGAVEVTA